MCGDQPGKIVIAGYSWGGYSATVLARELAKHGRKVDQMVLCDAVYRHNYWLGNWRALCPLSKIKIPKNVKEVSWFKQQKNYPRGHRIIAESDTTKINKPFELMFKHQRCDDSYLVHKEVFKACQATLGKSSTKY
jgi:thioesterase domain-containing protein